MEVIQIKFVENFLLKNYSLLTHLVELLAALTGVFLFKKYKNSYTKYFIYFLVGVTILEFVGDYTKYVRPDRSLYFLVGTIVEKNHWLFTVFWSIGAIMFFAFYYRKILLTKVFKTVIKYTSYCFLLISIIYILFHFDEFFYEFFPVISVLGAIIIFLCAVFYFLEILRSNKILTFYKSINFYISIAIFIWWLIITPLVFYDIYFTYEIGSSDRDLEFYYLRNQIFLIANIFMYSTYTFALIYCKPEQKND